MSLIHIAIPKALRRLDRATWAALGLGLLLVLRMAPTVRGASHAGPALPWLPRRVGPQPLAALLACTLIAMSAPALAACERGISPDAAKQLQDTLRVLGATDQCAWQRLDTQGSLATARWHKDGRSLSPLTIAPRGCLQGATFQGAVFDAALPEELARACPTLQAALPAALGGVRPPLPAAREQRGEAQGTLLERYRPPTRGIVTTFAVLWLLALLAAIGTLAISLRRDPPPRAWLLSLAGATALGLTVRLWVPPALANWYLEVLAPDGTGDLRFGPGALGLQQLLFSVFPTSDTTLFAASAIAGAAALPLTMGIARLLALPHLAALAAGLLLALLPLHVRISASGGAHVWASTAQLAALLLWMAGLQRANRAWLTVAGLLAFLAVATRVDVFPQLLFMAGSGWLLTLPPAEQRLRRRATGILVAAWLLLGALVWLAVVRPSHHPPPQLQEVLDVFSALLSQFVDVALRPPFWLSAVTVGLAAIGLLHAALHERRLLLLTALMLLCTFVPLGRTLVHDGLVAGRYFCFVFAWLCVMAGVGVGWLSTRIHRPPLRWGLLAALTLAAAWSALPALAMRYTFQDEYDFLRAATAALPSGCTVLQLPVRDKEFEGDFDGCLDAPRSPLTLARPDLHWSYLKLGSRLPAQPPGCLAYYQTALCEIQESPEVRRHFPHGSSSVRYACSEAQRDTSIRRLRDASLGGLTTLDLFAGRRPKVWLGRVGPTP